MATTILQFREQPDLEDQLSSSLADLPEILPTLVELDASRADEVCKLEQRCYRSPWSEQLIRNEFTKEISYRPGLQIGKDIVAYSFSYLIPQDLHILNIAVAPEYRGRGFGRCLLSSILAHGATQGVTCVSLEVRPSNVIARELYRSFGFRQIAVRKNYYRDNSEDALLLQLIMQQHTQETTVSLPPDFK